jgi:predicted nucleic acid-binding protein
MRRIPRVYIDTSVIGGCCDPEFEEWSNRLFDNFRAGVLEPVVSSITESELLEAPVEVVEIYQELQDMDLTIVEVSSEALELANTYIARGILTPKYRNDALHIAIATIANVDVLVSWNFQHIVRLDKIRRFNAVNLELGYKLIDIRSPREVANYGREED